MPTLWEMLRKKVEDANKPVAKPLEFQFYNPLGIRINHTMKIDMVEQGEDLAPLNFTLRQIRVVDRQVGQQNFQFVDYDVMARSLVGKPNLNMRVRLIPMEDPDANATHNVILFKKLTEFGYHQEFHEGLAFEKNNGEIQEHEAFEATYWRPDGITEPWECSTTLLRDEDNSGKVDENEARHGKLTYWDFHRQTTDDTGDFIEWYMVEMDDKGYFEIWVGKEISAVRISV